MMTEIIGNSFMKAEYGFAGNDADYSGVGFRIINGVASFYSAKMNGDIVDSYTVEGLEQMTKYIIRMYYSVEDGLIYCYINGVLICSLDIWPDEGSEILYITFYSYAVSSNSDMFQINNMSFANSLA
jgi:hypothetical protein